MDRAFYMDNVSQQCPPLVINATPGFRAKVHEDILKEAVNLKVLCTIYYFASGYLAFNVSSDVWIILQDTPSSLFKFINMPHFVKHL